ncbi:MAG: flavodoxin family protein [Firmicutes bacterium]|jgi:multimeric flavodoxin WrbA|nr:flavodoxin family protein [Bacillota bacterium]
MNIVSINGSPRKKGNTESLINKLLEGAKSNGHNVTSFNPNTMTIKGCQACMGCKSASGKCVQKDDMNSVYDAVNNSDVVVLGTPIYFGGMTAQLKNVFDRFFPYMPGKLEGNKKCVLIVSHGAPDKASYESFTNTISSMAKAIGFSDVEVFIGNDSGNEHPEYLEKCYEIGSSL